MTVTEKFNLKRTNFKKEFLSSFLSLKADDELCDITLACDDRTFKCHKIVLSFSSPKFEKIVKTFNQPNAVIYLYNANADSVASIIEYMYFGETTIRENSLELFIELAKELELKGISDTGKSSKGSDQRNDEIKEDMNVDNHIWNKPMTNNYPEEKVNNAGATQNKRDEPIEESAFENIPDPDTHANDDQFMGEVKTSVQIKSESSLDKTIATLIEKSHSGNWQCTACSQESNNKETC